jgi:hypothetical protein
MNPTDLPARMASKIRVDENGCWIWTGARQGNGYGSVGYNGASRLTHRVTYELVVGEIPEGLQIDHLCRVRSCCNPQHCEPVTAAENVRRRPASLVTHCPHGHEYSAENTFYKRGARQCRECRAAYHRARRRTT